MTQGTRNKAAILKMTPICYPEVLLQKFPFLELKIIHMTFYAFDVNQFPFFDN